jgi:DNA-binding CsgD family transcriptional regulator
MDTLTLSSALMEPGLPEAVRRPARPADAYASPAQDFPVRPTVGYRLRNPAPVPATRPGATPYAGHGATAESAVLRILDEIDYGLMLVTELGKVCLANHVALRECAASGTMQLRNGHVLPRQPHQQEPFLKALAASRQGRRAMMTLESELAPISLALVPVADSPVAGPDDAAMLLVFGKRRVCEPLSVEFYARSHHLTAAETTVLTELCNGLRPTEIAKRGGVALSTVRTQICSIRHKTGAASIADLVRMMIGLPPIIPALNRMNLAAEA